MQLLLENGAEPNYLQQGNYESPLLAMFRMRVLIVTPELDDQLDRRLDCATLLLDAGADITFTVPDDGTSESQNGSTAVEDMYDRTALHLAARAQNPAAVGVLLMAGADPTAEDRGFGQEHGQCNDPPIPLASYNVNWEVIRLLMSFGAPVPNHRGGSAPSAAIPNSYVSGTLEVAEEYVENDVLRATNDCVRKTPKVLVVEHRDARRSRHGLVVENVAVAADGIGRDRPHQKKKHTSFL